MNRFGKKSSSDIAVERLKLVLVHDRIGTSPDRSIVTRIKRDIIRALSDYVEIDVANFEVEIKRSVHGESGYDARLTADIPIKKIK